MMRNTAPAISRLASVRQWLSTRPLAAVLLLGFLLGAACFVVIPPWWHYDEPGHFEYAWLAAHSPTWPQPGQYDQSMRKQMAQSMLHYNWYAIRNYKPNFKSSQPIPIGVTQVGDQPGYYFLASLPLRLMGQASMIAQYYAARSVSLLLFLLIILAAWYALGEILPAGSPLRWMTTVFIALLPAFVDEMVSVNNDVSAVLAATLAIWACLRLVQKGYSVGRLVFLVLSLAACYLSKSTALFAFGVAPFAMILGFLRGRHAPYLWAASAVGLIAAAVLALAWGAPRSWYGTTGDESARVEQPAVPLGSHAFRLDDAAPGGSSQLIQVVRPDDVTSLRGQTATLGAWLWAGQPTQAGPLFIEFLTNSDTRVASPKTLIDVGTAPSFRQITFDVPPDAVSATIYLGQGSHGLSGNSVFVDGVVLVPGGFTAGAPMFAESDGAQVSWGGRLMPNLVRNASAEAGSFQLRRSVNERVAGLLGRAGISPDLTLALIQDPGMSWYYRGTLDTLFRTFWISLAGDKAVVPGRWLTYLLIFLTIAGALGALVRLWVARRSLPWGVAGLLAIALLLPWALTIARGSGDVLSGSALFPWARYAFPAILPAALMLCAGWLEWLERLARRLRLVPAVRDGIFFAVMLAISLTTIFNAVRIFHPAWWGRGVLPTAFVLLLAGMFYAYMRPSHDGSPPAP